MARLPSIDEIREQYRRQASGQDVNPQGSGPAPTQRNVVSGDANTRQLARANVNALEDLQVTSRYSPALVRGLDIVRWAKYAVILFVVYPLWIGTGVTLARVVGADSATSFKIGLAAVPLIAALFEVCRCLNTFWFRMVVGTLTLAVLSAVASDPHRNGLLLVPAVGYGVFLGVVRAGATIGRS